MRGINMYNGLNGEGYQPIPSDNEFSGWDAEIRGDRMSDSVGLVIWKYQMPVLETFFMDLPKGAKVIRTECQDGMFWMWAVVNSKESLTKRKFHAVKCGANVPKGNLEYIGFCALFVQQELGLYIFEDTDYVA